MKKSYSAVLVSTAIVGFTLAIGASPAYASNALPANNSLYLLDADGTDMYEMDANGSQTHLDLQLNPIGDGSYDAGALNPLDNRAYVIWNDNPDLVQTCSIDSIDMLGGPARERLQIVNSNVLVGCYAFNIDANGAALLYAFDYTDDLYGIWQIDLTTGAATNRVQIGSELYGFTVAPNGDWYALTDMGRLATINKVTGELTTIVDTTLNDAFECKFDTDGTLWFTNEDGSGLPPYQLYSWRIGDSDYTLQGDTSVDGDPTNGLFGPVFVGYSTEEIAAQAAAAALPNTGLDSAASLWLFVFGAVAVAGGIVAVRVRRRNG